MANRTVFEQENDELLKFILENRFFKHWANKEEQSDNKTLWADSGLELYLTTGCNQKCEYCYLHKYEDKLYPAEYRDKETIIHNLEVFLNWITDNDYFIERIDLFSGEIWHTSFGLEVLDILLRYSHKKKFCNFILIPSNCSFIIDDKTMYALQERIDAFNRLDIRFAISCSVDGKIIDNIGRQFKDNKLNETRDDYFYDKLFGFCKKNNYLFHPMVSAHNIKYWKENLDWYNKKIEEYGFDIIENPIMMLEVRNDDWTEESIRDLLDYYDYEIDIELKKLKNNIRNFSRALLGDTGAGNGYRNFNIHLAENQITCTASAYLSVRLGDLAIVPCHRLSYEELLYGKFSVENDKIVGLESYNPQMAIRTLCVNNKIALHGCDTCVYNEVCLKGCFGAQYEYGKDAFMPIPAVCSMLKSKYYHLYRRYEELGVIDEWKKIQKGDYFYDTAQGLLKSYELAKESGNTEGVIVL